MHDALIRFLQRLLPLSKAAKAQIRKYFQCISLPKNEHLLTQGSICNHLCFMVKGCCRFYCCKDQQEITHWFCFENDFIASLISFIDRKPSSESIQLLEDSQLLSIEYHHLQHLYDQYHEWDKIGRLIEENFLRDLQKRLTAFRDFNSKEKYLFLLRHEPHIIQRIPMKYISSYLGVTQETLSRIRASIQ